MSLFDFVMDKETYLETKRIYDEKLKQAEAIIICGLGHAAVHAFRYLERTSSAHKIRFVRDAAYASKGKTYFEQYPIIRDEELTSRYNGELVICTPKTPKGYHGCVQDMLEIGVPKQNIVPALDVIFFEDSEMYNKRKMPLKFLKQHQLEFEEAYDLLQDEQSKSVFSGVLNYKLSGDIEYLLPITSSKGGHGFDDEFFTHTPEDVYVDLGAYTGDTAKQYVTKTHGKYGKILCFEPDPDNYAKLLKWMQQEKPQRVYPYQIGAGGQKGTLTFSSLGNDSSYISDHGNITIEIDSVDRILDGTRADYIKLDVEGSEYDALLGAKDTIQKFHPTMCISCYHLQEDFYKLPILVKHLCPGYKLYLRQYLLRCTSTELYAVYKP